MYLQITGIPTEDVSREFLKAKMSEYGTTKYIDFRFGAVEAWIRCDGEKLVHVVLWAGFLVIVVLVL